ncbi:MAG: hypothetical protein AAGC79_11610 [Pseudomonadota bacterium]
MTVLSDPVRVSCDCGAVEPSVVLGNALDHLWHRDGSRRRAPCASVPEEAITVIKCKTLRCARVGTRVAEYSVCSDCEGHTRNAPTWSGIDADAIVRLHPRDVTADGRAEAV